MSDWITGSESLHLGGGIARIERHGLRWNWRVVVTTRDEVSQLEASGYSATQDAARTEAMRVAVGLRSLVG